MSRFLRAAALLAWLATASVPAVGQPRAGDFGRETAARKLFEEGVSLVDEERWADAADRFRRALELRPSPVIRFNLASALAKQGKAVEASELLREILRDESAQATTREPATELLAEVDRQIVRLTIEVRGDLAAHQVSLDGRTLHPAEIGVALPLDPGSHLVVGRRGDLTVFSREVSLAAGATERLTLDLPGPPARAPAPLAATAPPTPADPRDDAGGGPGWLLWAGAGVAVVGIAVVVTLLATSAGGGTAETFAGDFEPPALRVAVAP